MLYEKNTFFKPFPTISVDNVFGV